MARIAVILITSLFVFLSCAVQKTVKEEIALVIPKKGVALPETEQVTDVPGRPLEKIRGKAVIPPEKDVRKPGTRETTAMPGMPEGKVKGPVESVLPGELAEEKAGPGEELAIDEDIQFTEDIEKEMAVLFGKPIKETIVLFPFENLTNNRNALKKVIPVLTKKLAKKGFKAIDEDSLYAFLCKKRIRYKGYVSKELAGEIKEEFGIKTILTGSVIVFSRGEDPKFGIMARLIDASSTRILWADFVSVTGNDFTGILGLGKVNNINELVPRVLDILLAEFDPARYKEDYDVNSKIAVMPFRNISGFKNAGKIASSLFTIALLKNKKFEPVEYGNVREMIIDLRIRSKGELEYDNIEALSKALDLKGILVGTVEEYVHSSTNPKVTLSARLLDARKKNILWYNNQQLTGEKEIVAFDWGRLKTVDNVAYKLVSDLVNDLGKEYWR